MSKVLDCEAVLAEIWTDVLGCGGVRNEDVFIELGGDSIAATLCVIRVRRRLGIDVPIDTFLADLSFIDCVKYLMARASANAAE